MAPTFPISVPLHAARPILERLYLAPPAIYRVHFAQGQLAAMEFVFDRIIFTHGLRDVYFQYVMDQAEGSQKIRIEQVSNNTQAAA